MVYILPVMKDPQQRLARLPPALLYACFFASGLTSLVYELVWVRRLNLVFGSTTYSITTVLAAFMAGLGLGSYLVGRRVRAGRGGARTYAYLELGVAAYALCSLPLISGMEWVFAAAQGSLGLGQASGVVLKFVLAFPVLVVPAALMGGTLPALARAVVRSRAALHRGMGRLYGINTVGAALGTLLTGLVLIEHLGLWRSVILAALLNVCIGVAVLLVLRRTAGSDGENERLPREDAAPASRADSESSLLGHLRAPAVTYSVVAVAACGMLSMAYEVIWTRLLSLTMGSSTYSFTIILGIFLLGISGGSLLLSGLARRRPPRALTLAMFLSALAVWVTLTVMAVPHLPALWLYLAPLLQGSLPLVLAGETALAGALLLVPTMLFGAALPLGMGVAARELGQVGRDVGGIYLCNTLGAIAGSVLAGFVLVPLWGTRASLLFCLAVNLALAGAGLVLFSTTTARRLAGVVLVALMGTAAVLQPPWPAAVFDAGLGHRLALDSPTSPYERAKKLNWVPSRVLFQEEGVNATVTVRQFPEGLTLLVNDKPDASTHWDMGTQALLGTIPMLAHPRPRDVAVVGWGSGVTVHVTTFFGVRRVDAMELEQAVVRASPLFHRVNGAAERNPLVHVHHDDARSYLLTTRRRYDVLISEPSNPWMAGVSSLFSTDFYKLVRRRMRPGGVFGQWLQLYTLDSRSVALVLRTVLRSFTHVQLWHTDPSNLLLLASDRPIRLSLDRVRRAYQADKRLGQYMGAYGPGPLPEQFFGCFLLGRAALEKVVARFPDEVMTDDHPVLEYRAVRSLYRPVRKHMEGLWKLKLQQKALLPPLKGKAPPMSAVLAGASRLMRYNRPAADRITTFAMKRYPDEPFVWLARAWHLLDVGNHAAARKLLRKMPNTAGWNARRDLAMCRSLNSTRDHRRAIDALRILEYRPTARRLCQLDALIGMGQHDRAWTEAETLLKIMAKKQSLERDVLGLKREQVYRAIGRLARASKSHRRAIVAVSARQERDSGETDRLKVLLQAQIAARRPPGEVASTLGHLLDFGLTSRDYLKLCSETFGEAGQRARAEACERRMRVLFPRPRDASLWQ